MICKSPSLILSTVFEAICFKDVVVMFIPCFFWLPYKFYIYTTRKFPFIFFSLFNTPWLPPALVRLVKYFKSRITISIFKCKPINTRFFPYIYPSSFNSSVGVICSKDIPVNNIHWFIIVFKSYFFIILQSKIIFFWHH